MKRIILCVVAAALFLSGGLTLPAMVSSAAASEIVLTSVGQSPDATMIRVVLPEDEDQRGKPACSDLKAMPAKILVAVVGGSSKGPARQASTRTRRLSE